MASPTGCAKMDEFTRGYIECALWSSTTGDDMGTPLDSIDAELSADALASMTADCVQFQEANRALLDEARETRADDHLGHDFWLTRNRHGSGFWDRSELSKELQTALTDAAHAMGEVDLYVSDSGEVEQA